MSMKGKETMSNEKIVVGKFGATYGIRGWLKVFFPTQTMLKAFSITALGTLTKRASGLSTK